MARPFGTKKLTPETLWQLFEDYQKWTKENPRVIYDYVGRDGNKVAKPVEVPLTMEGFRCWGYDNDVTVKNYFDNVGGAYDDYYTIVTRIREKIRRDQIEGGMAGQFNQSLTARLNGLTDKQQIDIAGQVKILNIDPLSD
jgi:hypothetical protein